jgi:hypothetical protein
MKDIAMRKSSLFSSTWVAAALLALTLGVCGADGQTFNGNWHLNLEKSRWASGAKPGNVVIVIDYLEPLIQYRGAVIYSSEDMRVFAFAGALDGKPYRASRSYGEGTVALHRVDPLTIDSIFRTDNGLYTETARTALARDGKTLTRRLTVESPDGRQSWVEVYDRR